MLTEDYLMRWIRITTAAIARALGLRAATLYTDAIFLLSQTMHTLVGLSGEMVDSLDDSGVISFLTGPEGVDTDRLTLLGDLIKEQADVYAEQRLLDESTWRYQRALNFYLEVVRQGGPTRVELPYEKILSLSRQLESNLPPETLFELFSYFENAGRFDEADRILTHLLKQVGPQADLQEAARSFYSGLLAKSDLELVGGGMPRAQVQSRLEKLR